MQPVPGDATCLQCGYALRELTGGYCPECGWPFNPSDPATYAQPSQWPWWRWASPPGAVHLLVVFVAAGVVLDGFSAPRSMSIEPCVGWLLLPLVIADYVTRVWAVRRMWRHSAVMAGTSRPRNSRSWRWLITPLLIGAICCAVPTDWPLHARFRLSRPALERVAKSQTGNSGGAQWIGLYRIKEVSRVFPNACIFVIDNSFEPVGFVYHPAGLPSGFTDRRRLAACWSLWEN